MTYGTAPAQELANRPVRERSREDSLPARLWGLTVPELWASFLSDHQIQLVLAGSEAPLESRALYLLCDSKHVMDFDIAKGVEAFRRSNAEFAWVRLKGTDRSRYRERYVTENGSDRLMRVERLYNSPRFRSYRMALTRNENIAKRWQHSGNSKEFRGQPHASESDSTRAVVRVPGVPYDLSIEEDVAHFMVRLIQRWSHPERKITAITSTRPGVKAADPAAVSPDARVVGDIWVGSERVVNEGECVVGPAVLWDRACETPLRRPSASSAPSAPYSPMIEAVRKPRKRTKRMAKPIYRAFKRLFDIAFAIIALALTLPFYPIIALLIYLEDGRPIFFGHRRETKGGRTFACMKFRSMRRDAEEIRRKILEQNMCDGPQFFIDRDPRLTRVGRVLRDIQVDEWPQFFHVLTGKMSVVGPRPLPEPENQYCPAWREARLSVRPGITGLWQIKRRRLPGLDFQEWIRYDIEYVENCSMGLDLWIILQSVLMLFRLGWAVVTRRSSRQQAPDSAGLPRIA